MRRALLVRDVMRPPVTAPERMWFHELARLLRDQETGLLTIVDAGGRAVGAVTEADLLLKLARRWVEARPPEPESPAAGPSVARRRRSPPAI